MPGPLVLILAAQSVGLVWLLVRARKTRREVLALALQCELVGNLARSAYSAAWRLLPEEQKSAIPQEWRQAIESFAQQTELMGAQLMTVSPADLLAQMFGTERPGR